MAFANASTTATALLLQKSGTPPTGAGGLVLDKNFDTIATLLANVKQFGAVGDGVTNDTAAFVAAIAAVKTGTRILRIPAGTYILDTITDFDLNMIVYGDGVGVTILKSRVGATLIEVTAKAFHNFVLRDMTLDGNTTGVGHGIYIYSGTEATHHTLWENLEIKNFGGNQVRCGNSGIEGDSFFSSSWRNVWLRGRSTSDHLFFASRFLPTNTIDTCMIWEVPTGKVGYCINGYADIFSSNGVVANDAATTGGYAIFTGGVNGFITMRGCNLESFRGVAIDSTVGMVVEMCDFAPDVNFTDGVAIIARNDVVHSITVINCRFSPELGYDAQTPWSHSLPLHTAGGRFVIIGGTTVDEIWAIGDGFSYAVAQIRTGFNNIGAKYSQSIRVTHADIMADLITWRYGNSDTYLATMRQAWSNGDVLANSAAADLMILLPAGKSFRIGKTADNVTWTDLFVLNANGTESPPALTADPTGAEGQMYYNTTSHVLKVHNGTAWKTVTMV